MAKHWQKTLPIAQSSVRHTGNYEKELWRSEPCGPSKLYRVAVTARWDDTLGNGSNSFYVYFKVLRRNGQESEKVQLEDCAVKIPQEFLDLKKWYCCHPFGPWYYLENTTYLASDKDHNGLRKGEIRQRGNQWKLVLDGPTTFEGVQPQVFPSMSWEPVTQTGDGKEPNLEAARGVAIWPEATSQQLQDEVALKERLPGLLEEFRKVVEGLGFVW